MITFSATVSFPIKDTSSSPLLYEAIELPLLILLLALLLAYWLWRRQAIDLRQPIRNDAVVGTFILISNHNNITVLIIYRNLPDNLSII